tara:strand:+ start:179 stop:601 length:423 start_codon:yes stop_codon:yes gene_type:complete
MRKQNEIAIFETYRIKISKDEKSEVEMLKKQFKESPISTTGLLIIDSICAPFVSKPNETVDYFKNRYSNLSSVFKSSIRDAAISDVTQKIRKKNKKAYEYKKDELENLILKEEKRIKKKGRLWLIKRLAIVWGIGFLPFQ